VIRVLLVDDQALVRGGLRAILEDPACRGSKVVVLTTFDLDEYVYEALRLGASG
jgi:DNA-binding NarL/FixJ family response regulator